MLIYLSLFYTDSRGTSNSVSSNDSCYRCLSLALKYTGSTYIQVFKSQEIYLIDRIWTHESYI